MFIVPKLSTGYKVVGIEKVARITWRMEIKLSSALLAALWV